MECYEKSRVGQEAKKRPTGREKMSGFPALMRVGDALELIRKSVVLPSLDVLRKPFSEVLGMVVAEDIIVPVDVPPFDRSAVEGYAVQANRTSSATTTNPVELQVIGKSEAGTVPGELPRVPEGTAVEIYTGGPLPEGADAVVMVEFTKRTKNSVLLYKAVAPGQNVSKKGEDFARSTLMIRKNTVLKPWHIGALASVNLTSVPVYRRIKVAMLSTGNELREAGEALRPGEIINSSKPMLRALLTEVGCEFVDCGTATDDISVLTKSLGYGLEHADILITTGGTSLGEKDLVPEAINELGSPGIIVHGVAMRPAKPTGCGVVNGKPVFMLSGYPVAALVGFDVFALPTIRMFQRTEAPLQPTVRAKLTRRLATPSGVRCYVRVRVFREGDELKVEPLRLTGSGLLSTMTRANGILVIPEDVEGFDQGHEVEVNLFQPIEAL